MNGETRCARILGSPGPAEPENLAHLLLPSLHHSNGATCAGMGGTPRSAPTPIKNALFTKRIYHSKSGPDFSIFARSLLLPTPNERKDQMCQVSLPAPQQRQGQMCRNGGEPRDRPRPQSKTHFLRKEFITQNLALDFSIFARSLLLPPPPLHPMNGETKCARFLGSPGPAEPENLAHLLLPSLHHSNGKATCAGMGGTPRSAPTPIKNALFTKRIYHSKSGPDFSISAPTPIKNALFTKRIYHSKSGPDFSIFARSLLLPTPNERRDQMCQVFGLARARGARKPGTFAPSLPAPAGIAGTPRSAPTPVKNALFTKRIYHSKSGPDFSIFARSLLLPTASERRDQMCQVFGLARARGARKPGTFAPSLLAPQQRQGHMCRNGGNPEIGPDPNQKRTFYEKNLSLKIWP